MKYATVVHVLPYAEDLEGVTGETFETFLQPFFEGEFKPVSLSVNQSVTQSIIQSVRQQVSQSSVCQYVTLSWSMDRSVGQSSSHSRLSIGKSLKPIGCCSWSVSVDCYSQPVSQISTYRWSVSVSFYSQCVGCEQACFFCRLSVLLDNLFVCYRCRLGGASIYIYVSLYGTRPTVAWGGGGG